MIHLYREHFGTQNIARIMLVSRRTVQRRLGEAGLLSWHRSYFTEISEERLISLVQTISWEHAHTGWRMMQGFLEDMDVVVPRDRVRAALLAVDPVGTKLRWGRLIKRRVYQVSGANALWHADGNHKLIRWRFVIHGCIDGFSRLVVFLDVHADNTAQSVLASMTRAVERFGLPSRMRTDYGTENFRMREFMLMQRGEGRGSFIMGRSTHNQRIERLWRDLYEGCTYLYYEVFSHFDSRGLLDAGNDLHIELLHFVFLPRIQRSLDQWAKAWNKHPMSTMHGRSPLSTWFSSLQDQLQSTVPVDEHVHAETYGIDFGGDVAPEQTNNNVVVPPIQSHLSEQLRRSLTERFDPLQDSDCFGMDIYANVIHFVAEALRHE
jgi:hypothetical protein